MERKNGNYTIINALDCGDHEIVIGFNPNNCTPWVTWRAEGDNYCLGNYFMSREAAYENFFRRSMTGFGIRAATVLDPSDKYQVYMECLRDHVKFAVEDHLASDYNSYEEMTDERKQEVVDGITDGIMQKIEDLDFNIFDDEKIEWEIDDCIEYDDEYEDLKEDE